MTTLARTSAAVTPPPQRPAQVSSSLELPRVYSLPSRPWTLRTRKTRQGMWSIEKVYHVTCVSCTCVQESCTLGLCDIEFYPTSNTTTPRRKLSLEMDDNAQSPFSTEQDVGEYCTCESECVWILHVVIQLPNKAQLVIFLQFRVWRQSRKQLSLFTGRKYRYKRLEVRSRVNWV